jgi:uncharacterized Zn finger protein (UPF0148 family)
MPPAAGATCEACGKPYARTSNRQRFCPPCGAAKEKERRAASKKKPAVTAPRVADVPRPSSTYAAVIAELKAKRDAIDAAIKGLEALA